MDPVLIALTDVAAALLPFDVSLDVEPGLVLPLLVAPALLDAAFDTFLHDLRLNCVRSPMGLPARVPCCAWLSRSRWEP